MENKEKHICICCGKEIKHNFEHNPDICEECEIKIMEKPKEKKKDSN